MFRKKNIIEFISISKYYENVITDTPSPASKFVPQWWKNMQPYVDNKLKIHGHNSSATGKKCMPMFDAIACGYIIPLWADAMIVKTGDGHSASWKTQQPLFGVHDPRQSNGVEIPEGYSESAFKYHNPWVIKTPPGWSCLITHPFGYPDLPFKMISAIVDTDIYPQDINPVFWIKKNFEGIIEAGTPMVQVIPIKRSKWDSKFSSYTEEQHMHNQEKNIGKTIVNNYVKNIWQKKEYK
jgi:hypothetical protein